MSETNPEAYNTNLAKITRPRFEGILLRTSLFSKLDELRKKPVIWVSGPAGSGKTTLVSSYIEHSNLPCLWYQIDGGDSDLATFFYYLSLADKKVSPYRQKPLPYFTPEYTRGIPAFSRIFFTEFFAYLKQPCAIVFDNYQDVAEDALVHEALIEGLSRMPKTIHFIFISRAKVLPKFSRLKANQIMGSIDWQRIRLTEQEFERILTMQCGPKVQVPRAVTAKIYEKLDGWVAGLHLLLEVACPDRIDTIGAILDKSPEEIFDYFACEIFERHDADVRNFMLKTALLPFASSDMANKMSGRSDGGEILTGLNRKNHFTIQRTEPILSYQFHPLFREFLLHMAHETYTSQELIDIKRQAASVLIESKQTEHAAVLLQEAGDWEGLSTLILDQAPFLIQQGRNMLLVSWIQHIPQDVISKKPWLKYWLASSRMPFAPHESKLLFEEAFHLFKQKNDVEGLYAAWAGVAESIYYSFKGFQEYKRWLEVFEEIKEQYCPYPSQKIELRMTVAVFRALVYGQPFHKDYQKWVGKVAELVESDIDKAMKPPMLQLLCVSQIFCRDFIKAGFFVELFKSYVESTQAPPMTHLMQLQMKAFYLWQVARFEECRKTVSKGLKVAAESGIHLLDHFNLNYQLSAALSQGEVDDAQAIIKKMFTCIDEMSDWPKAYFYMQVAWLNVLQGNLEQTLFFGEKGYQYVCKVAMPISTGFQSVWMAYFHHLAGNYQISDQFLAESGAIYKAARGGPVSFDYYLHKAYIDLERGRTAEGLEALRVCFSAGRKYGNVNTYQWNPNVMAKLCSMALDKNIEIEYTKNLIRRRNLLPLDPLSVGERWPWPIKIYTFGGFRLVLDDEPFVTRGKAQQKPLAMLKLLIAYGGRGVEEEKISYNLWPDADGDLAHQSFTTTLHRLRKLLGNKKALVLQDGKLSLDQRLCWIDSWEFEHLLDKAESTPGKSFSLFEKAVSFYKGPFLATESHESWSIAMGERLRNKFLRNICSFAKRLQKEERWDKAIEVLNRGLDVDNLAEEFYQELMTCYQQLGRQAEAISVYQKCRKILTQTLDVEPSLLTKKIYTSLSCQEKTKK